MKYLLQICIFLIVFTSCKTNKNVIDARLSGKKISAKKVARKHILSNLDKETVSAKLKVKFVNGKKKQTLSVTMRILKDEVIWLKATKIVTILKAKITPKGVQYYSPLFKNYFAGDFSSLEKILGVKVNFEQLQNLLLGQSVHKLKKLNKYVEIKDNSYVLSPRHKINLVDLSFFINPSHFKLNKQSIVNNTKNTSLDILYPNYKIINNEVFPARIKIIAKQKNKFTTIDLNFKSVKFNTNLNTYFKIPSNYNRINL